MITDPQSKFVIYKNYLGCNMCPEPGQEPFYWCDHVKQAVQENRDAFLLHPGMRVNVPVMPDANIWAEVHIASDNLPGGIARMEMLYKPEFANLKKVDLGFWNPGEGLWVMRTCIIDWIRSKLDPRENVTNTTPIVTPCPSTSTHNLEARRWMVGGPFTLNAKWECLWNIVLEGACTYCMAGSSDSSRGGLNDA